MKVCDTLAKMMGFGERKRENHQPKSEPGGLKPLMSIKYHQKPKNDPIASTSSTIDPVTQVDKTEEFEVKTFY
jgi:hypothetical protein